MTQLSAATDGLAVKAVSRSHYVLPVLGAMALDIGAAAAIVTADPGAATADGICRVLLKGRGLQIAEMSDRQGGGVMAVRAASAAMRTMPAGGIAVVLGGAALMTGRTLGIDIDGAGCPGRGRLAAMTTGAGTGAAVAAGRAALGIEVGQDADVGRAVIMGCAVMAGPAARVDRTETESGMGVMGPGGVGETAPVWRLAMTGGAAGVNGVNIGTVAGSTVAAAGRNPGLQVRNRGMTEAAISIMRYGHRGIGGCARIVAGHADGRSASHIARRHMVDTAVGRGLVSMAIQAVGGIGACCDGVHDRLPRTVMTGGAGAGPVGGDIMRGTFDLRPVRHAMAAATGAPVGEVAGSQRNSMGMG